MDVALRGGVKGIDEVWQVESWRFVGSAWAGGGCLVSPGPGRGSTGNECPYCLVYTSKRFLVVKWGKG